jgi:hypothetical protein
VLALHLPPDRLADYLAARSAFEAEFCADADAAAALQDARTRTLQRADTVVAEALADPVLMTRLRGALRGVEDARLDREYPGWDVHLEGYVDGWSRDGARVATWGWVFAAGADVDIELGVGDPAGHVVVADDVEWVDRPEVGQVFGQAPLRCGFSLTLTLDGAVGDDARVVARPVGTSLWSELTPGGT